MKRIIILLAFLAGPGIMMCMGQSNREARIVYVLQNLGIKRDVQKKLRPLLAGYLAEKKQANAEYEAMKTKLKTKIDLETINNTEAEKLLEAKWEAAAKELAVKKDYDKKFRTVISVKKTYRCFDLLNDKKSKVRGSKKDDDDWDE